MGNGQFHTREVHSCILSFSLDEIKANTTGACLSDEATGAQQYWDEINYTLTLRRRPSHYVYVMVLPSVLIATLCLFGLFTPDSTLSERTEKVRLFVTTPYALISHRLQLA